MTNSTETDYVVYLTTNLLDGKKYIGRDKYNDPSYLGSGKWLKKAINKYGVDNFKKEILEHCKDEEEASKRELYHIEINKAQESSEYYNIGSGGLGGDNFTHHPDKENYRRKIGEGSKRSHNTPEYFKKSSESRKRLWKDPVYREKISKRVREAQSTPEYREKRTKLSKEQWNKPGYREKHSGSNTPTWGGYVYILTSNDQFFIYESVHEANKVHKINKQTLHICNKEEREVLTGTHKGTKIKISKEKFETSSDIWKK